ncbi:MAG: DegV family protein [Oscillospiraceae bacterium]|nr:DegV family protein [Oscillospiraceae bacterium]
MENRDFVIVTDSTCDLPEQYVKDNNLVVINLGYSLEDKDYDGSIQNSLTPKEFYDKVRNGSMPKTSMISPEQAEDAFEEIIQSGRDVLYIGFSSALSGSYNSGRIAAEMLSAKHPDFQIISIDSLCASLGEGLFVNYAVDLKKQGLDIKEVAQKLESDKQKFLHYFTVSDLHHLHRGGRVSKASAVIGSMLGIKPVLHVDENGKLIPIAKVRGRKQSLDMLVEKMGTKLGSYINKIVYISHGDCIEDAEYVAKQVKEKYNIKEFIINTVGPVVGAHSGPGTIALFFVGTNRAE